MTDRIEPETFDKCERTVSIRCQRCRWKFRCPVEQVERVLCRSCEGVTDAKATTQAR